MVGVMLSTCSAISAHASVTGVGRTSATIEIVAQRLLWFGADHCHFPSTEDGLRALTSSSSSAGQDRSYVKPALVTDGWGQPLVYRYPAEFGSEAFDLYSIGANGIDEHGGGDDVSSWKGHDRRAYRLPWRGDALLSAAILLDGPLILAFLVAHRIFIATRRRMHAGPSR